MMMDQNNTGQHSDNNKGTASRSRTRTRRLQKMVEVHATLAAHSVRRPLHPGILVAIVTAVSQQARVMATIRR